MKKIKLNFQKENRYTILIIKLHSGKLSDLREGPFTSPTEFCSLGPVRRGSFPELGTF